MQHHVEPFAFLVSVTRSPMMTSTTFKMTNVTRRPDQCRAHRDHLRLELRETAMFTPFGASLVAVSGP